jgi:hypothetical protein
MNISRLLNNLFNRKYGILKLSFINQRHCGEVKFPLKIIVESKELMSHPVWMKTKCICLGNNTFLDDLHKIVPILKNAPYCTILDLTRCNIDIINHNNATKNVKTNLVSKEEFDEIIRNILAVPSIKYVLLFNTLIAHIDNKIFWHCFFEKYNEDILKKLIWIPQNCISKKYVSDDVKSWKVLLPNNLISFNPGILKCIYLTHKKFYDTHSKIMEPIDDFCSFR